MLKFEEDKSTTITITNRSDNGKFQVNCRAKNIPRSVKREPTKRSYETREEAELIKQELKHIKTLYETNKDPADSVYAEVNTVAFKIWFDVPHEVSNNHKTELIKKEIPTHALLAIKNGLISSLRAQLKIEKDLNYTMSEKIVYFDSLEYIQRAEVLKNVPSNNKLLHIFQTEFADKRADATGERKAKFLHLDKDGLDRYDRVEIDRIKHMITYISKDLLEEKSYAAVTWEDIEDYLRYHTYHQRKKKRPNPADTWRRAKNTICYFYEIACKHGKFPNPSTSVKSKKGKKRKIEFLRPDQSTEIIDNINTGDKNIDAYWKAFVCIQVWNGLSAHEARSLKLSDVNFKSGFLSIESSEEADTQLKHGNRFRSIMINDILKPYLKAYLATGLAGEYLFPHMFYINKDKRPYSTSSSLSQQIANAGIFPEDDVYGMVVNCLTLRRTFASILVLNGVSYQDIAAVMGNTAAVVERNYGRVKSKDVDINVDLYLVETKLIDTTLNINDIAS